MKVKALVSFCGKISMTIGEEREIKDEVILEDLVAAGYVETVGSKKKKVNTDED